MRKPRITSKTVDGHLGEQLQRLREQRGLSMSAVGREIGTTYQQVRKYEIGQNRISASTLFRLAQVLKIEVSDFFKGLPGKEGPTAEDATSVPILGHIEDGAVRHHLAGLLQALGSRR